MTTLNFMGEKFKMDNSEGATESSVSELNNLVSVPDEWIIEKYSEGYKVMTPDGYHSTLPTGQEENLGELILHDLCAALIGAH